MTLWPSRVTSRTPLRTSALISARISRAGRLYSEPRTSGTMQYAQRRLQPSRMVTNAECPESVWASTTSGISSGSAVSSRPVSPARARATKRGIAPARRVPTAKSRPGTRAKISAPSRCAIQPMRPTSRSGRSRLVAHSRPSLPSALSSAFARTLHELTTTRSASSSRWTGVWPAASSRAVTASESRTFIWQP